MQKEAVMVKAITQHLPGGSKDTKRNLIQDSQCYRQYSNQKNLAHKAEVL
jgi:hypothetical protein